MSIKYSCRCCRCSASEVRCNKSPSLAFLSALACNACNRSASDWMAASRALKALPIVSMYSTANRFSVKCGMFSLDRLTVGLIVRKHWLCRQQTAKIRTDDHDTKCQKTGTHVQLEDEQDQPEPIVTSTQRNLQNPHVTRISESFVISDWIPLLSRTMTIGGTTASTTPSP